MNDQSIVVLKSIADSTRLSVVKHIYSQGTEVSCSEVTKSCSTFLNLSQPTMSHHFGRLVQSGVLLERKVSAEKYYKLNSALLSQLGIDITKL